ncbi:MAG: phage terminase large subunit [Rhodovarius sp.]|nr:phage terminase large subunit [Rhodovarius sp.]MCX7932875.1 phage terminase large subunit [Rhodovarius sp.]
MTIPPAADFPEFVWLWNELQGQAMPPHHRRMARWLAERHAQGHRRLLLMAFRGAGKSSLVGLFCAWWLAREPEARILVLAAEHSLAQRMVAQVRRIIERHPLCAHLLPAGAEAWAADRFTVARRRVLRDPSMLAQGIGGNITGARADLIVCDDVEVPGNCDTPAKREELRTRLAEAEFVLVPGGTLLFVGTPHCAESLYRPGVEPLLKGCRRLRLPLLDRHGRSAWPERFDAQTIAALRERVGPLAFARQMQLEPIQDAAARLDPALIIAYREEPAYREAQGRAQLFLLGRRMVSGAAFWDPAFGRPDRGDGSVLACAYADAEGRFYLQRVLWLTADDMAAEDAATQQCRAVAAVLRALHLPAVFVETNGIGRFLPALLRRVLAAEGVAAAVREHANHRPKQERILGALDPLLAARRLYAHAEVLAGPFAREMAAWRPDDRNARDDALDAVASLVLSEPVRLPLVPLPPRPPPWRGGA